MPEDNYFNNITKDLPYNLEAEQSVLGSILIDYNCYSQVSDILKPECFYRKQNSAIYSIIVRKYTENSSSIDLVTVLDSVIKEKIFDNDNDAKVYLSQLVETVPTTVNVELYANIVKEKYILRSIIHTFENIIVSSREQEVESSVLLDMAEQQILDIRAGKDVNGLIPISNAIAEAYTRLQALNGEDREDYLGIPSGFDELDKILTGFNKSDLLILAARPGMGKTAFALNVAVNIAKKRKKVAVFSLEMSNEQLVERVLSSEAFIPSENMRTGNLETEDWTNLAVASSSVSNIPIVLDQTSAITVNEIKSRVRRQRDISFVVIDYLQLLSSGNKYDSNRVQVVSEMTRNLKIMAKELNVPVLVLSQLSRGPESRTDKRPMLADLRESGSIEQDADVVLFLYRDDYYNKNSDKNGLTEVIVAKNRHGRTGSINLGWDGKYTKFRNIAKIDDEQ